MTGELVFVGGGHAHLTALVRMADYIRRGHRVTLISPVTHHYYSGMGPGMLSRIYAPEDIRFHLEKLAADRGASFIKGRVVRVRPADRLLILESGREVSYDVVSFNTGSSVPTNLATDGMKNVFPVKPIVNLLKAQRTILDMIAGGKPHIVVAGGGPAGVELSGNIHRLVSEHGGEADITLVSGGKLLPSLPDKVRKLVLVSFQNRCIRVLEHSPVIRIEDGETVLLEGTRLRHDVVFLALGVKPSPLFKASGLPVGDEGGLLVNDYLQSVGHPEMFGGGDCVSFQSLSLDKVGVYAVRQNPVLHHNLMAALEGGQLERFLPQKVYMLIFNLGDGTGIFVRKKWVWNGRSAFLLKDYIDRAFMRKFQVSGEREDHSDAPE
ncbi:MAG TPA: FAD-dependent oxidoreductase [Desulfomonilaceae bacterium]|nr:FAD-dependent oxidoreductase [Desulfomonilaceae bacterium]